MREKTDLKRLATINGWAGIAKGLVQLLGVERHCICLTETTTA
uniref:Uncharacterized protein n=1 Tax=Vitis vinifera TaxID=29760 RepID=F6H1R7_VITVI